MAAVVDTRVCDLADVALAVHYASVDDTTDCRASTAQCKDNSKQKQKRGPFVRKKLIT